MFSFSGKNHILYRYALCLFLIISVLFLGLSNNISFSNGRKEININNQNFITNVNDNTIHLDLIEPNAFYGPYYYTWTENPWPESSTSSWSTFQDSGSYRYSYGAPYFSFTEEGTGPAKFIDTGIYRSIAIRDDAESCTGGMLEFNIRFRTWNVGLSGGFEESYCRWYAGYQTGTGHGSNNIDSVVKEGWIGSSSSWTVYKPTTLVDSAYSNILYTIGSKTPGTLYTFTIGTEGTVQDSTLLAADRCQCYIYNVRLFSLQYRRYITVSDLTSYWGNIVDIDGDGFKPGSTITAVWVGSTRISQTDCLIGSRIIQSDGQIPDNFGIRVPTDLEGEYSSIRIETSYQTTTFDSSTGFPGITIHPRITINGNSDFTLYTKQGNGLQSTPYILDGYSLNLQSTSSYGVSISNTNAYFIVQNSIIYNGNEPNHGIIINSVQNGVFENNEIYNIGYVGIYAEEMSNCNFTNNQIYNNLDGIIFDNNCHNNNIGNNFISNNYDIGLYIDPIMGGSHSNYFNYNLIEYNGNYGIFTQGSTDYFVRNYIWLNTGANIYDGGISETWSQNLVTADGDFDSDLLENRDEVYAGTDPFSPDSDGDGIPDGWEVAYLLDPLDDSDSIIDTDLDGLVNLAEYQHNTNPLLPDTDEDGIIDGSEVFNYGTSPTNNDTDSDNISDFDELFIYGTDPNKADSDSDGLTDFYEITVSLTDPNNPDTDSDGLPDSWELDNGTDPNVDDANGDEDSDGLTNFEEYTLGTNPQSSDSDSDGMPDKWEHDNGLDPLTYSSDNDEDDDDLTDLDEYLNETDPNDTDTDGDGYPDGTEVEEGTNPTDPDDYPVEESPTPSTSPTMKTSIPIIPVILIASLIIGLNLKSKRNKNN
ncbi:MAG: hypothetical protein FK734_20610 [Asgard group archaeon]|nr:hypothetical protein [Asgard group archaeon]